MPNKRSKAYKRLTSAQKYAFRLNEQLVKAAELKRVKEWLWTCNLKSRSSFLMILEFMSINLDESQLFNKFLP